MAGRLIMLPYTSCWSKGVGGRYAYYLCQAKECPDRGKSIPKKVIEDEFEKLLAELTPSPDLFYTAAEIFSTLWDHRCDNGKDEVTFMKRELLRFEKQSEHFINRIAETQSINLIVAYEGKVESWKKTSFYSMKRSKIAVVRLRPSTTHFELPLISLETRRGSGKQASLIIKD